MRNVLREPALSGRRGDGGAVGSIAVGIDRDNASRQALKWVLQNVSSRYQTVKLVHVLQRSALSPSLSHSPRHAMPYNGIEIEWNGVQCEVVLVEDLDIAKGLVDFVSYYAVENLFLGAATKSFSRLFKTVDTPSSVMKSAPDFCNVYVIGKGKVASARTASRPAPTAIAEGARLDGFGQPRRGSLSERPYDEIPTVESLETDQISYVDSARLSTDSNFLSFYETLGSPLQNDSHMRLDFEEFDFDQDLLTGSNQQVDLDLDNELPALIAYNNEQGAQASNIGSPDDDTRRLMMGLQRTMDMYHAACKEAITAKQMVLELGKCKIEAERKLQDAHLAERAAVAMMEKERARCRAALEEAEAARWLADHELQKMLSAETRALKEAEEKRRIMDATGLSDMVIEYRSLFHMIRDCPIWHHVGFEDVVCFCNTNNLER
ncbi:U-box domain-containing protein 35-like [Punica granatum]|uniref:RING-type E3 ubiquitin transferase n=1 Tax=Punica granatum TaxID=22663 RepID=A0A6P8BUT8_PUNGR|nr:U-box domain-containing protein 35-like [Punica granatum]